MIIDENIAWKMLGKYSKIWTEVKEQLAEDNLV